MKERVQIEAGHRAVWVNVAAGCIGRFGRMGIDVHRAVDDPQYEVAGECLHCTHGPVTEQDWTVFQEKMLELHGVEVPDRFKPDWWSPKSQVLFSGQGPAQG